MRASKFEMLGQRNICIRLVEVMLFREWN